MLSLRPEPMKGRLVDDAVYGVQDGAQAIISVDGFGQVDLLGVMRAACYLSFAQAIQIDGPTLLTQAVLHLLHALCH
eukprot:5759860-Pyramimonas_sp.AAC.1